MAQQQEIPDVKVRMKKPAIVRFGHEDNAPVLKIPLLDPETQRPTEITVTPALAADWVETGIADYVK